jgi:hypothetical protein
LKRVRARHLERTTANQMIRMREDFPHVEPVARSPHCVTTIHEIPNFLFHHVERYGKHSKGQK